MPACTMSVRVAEWDSEPLLAWAVIMKLPVAALVEAPKTKTAFAPDVMLNGLAGFDATPFGRPARVTWPAPVKPFWPATETVSGGPVAPCESDSELEESAIEKSAGDGGGGCTVTESPLPPAHPAPPTVSRSTIARGGT